MQDEICKCSDKPATRNSRGGEEGEGRASRGLYIKQKCARCQGYGGKRATKKCRFDKGCKLEKKKGGGSEGWKKRERERERSKGWRKRVEREVEETEGVESRGRGRWFERARIIFAEEQALPLFVVAGGTPERNRG